jgi:glycine cleavage system H protein
MSERVFMMGEFEATFPTDREYCSNHMWAQRVGDVTRFGFTAYAVRLLQDVYFLEWSIDEDCDLAQRQTIGAIESKKAESDLFAPAAGRMVRFNEALLDDPSAINVDKYGEGWLFEMQDRETEFMTADEYITHLDSVWEITQRTIKGQLS